MYTFVQNLITMLVVIPFWVNIVRCPISVFYINVLTLSSINQQEEEAMRGVEAKHEARRIEIEID